MPDAGPADFDHVKADIPGRMEGKKALGGITQMPLLFPVYGPDALAQIALGPGLYLNEHQGIPIQDDEINLAVGGAIAFFQDFHAHFPGVCGGPHFAH